MKMVAASLPLVAWTLSVSLTLYLRRFLDMAGATILVPVVSISDSAGSDVISDVTAFVVVLGWGLISTLLVEPAKAVAHRAQCPLAVYSLLVACQIVLVADTIRAHTSDWWSWLLSVFGLVTLKPAAEVEHIIGFRFPWISLIFAIAAGVVIFRLPRSPTSEMLEAKVQDPIQPATTTPTTT